MLTKILSFFGGTFLKEVTGNLQEAYKAKLAAQNDHEKLEAEQNIALLQVQRDILVAEQGRAMTAWIRPALAFPVIVLVWKLLIWDTVLGLDVTPDPGVLVMGIVWTILGAYFVTRPFERR